MEIKLGMTDGAREVSLNVQGERDTILADIKNALADSDGVLELTDDRGQTVVVKNSRIAWAVIGSATTGRVGFFAS